ncbi:MULTISPECIES: TldD/PmbA family protein [unclassified Methanoculleus]|jgi:TldD protein|uniref:TldD/PmbA family protein n=1 Tax=Methanoculleus palmolei TaxID=72612 RepID=A0ABD8AAZ7_9EURY|nr:TldD/PmbA family protein [Methanoculleus sp. UBA377]MDD2472489.1 TldD/PmbA family protein [Methanoculleus sp.]WOX56710.1 TldD/PmbA family protein [Methanoculleus palmolei]
MVDVRYYDLRCVRGENTLIDIDNGVVESAGTSFFDRTVVRVLGQKGWGVLTRDHVDIDSKREIDALVEAAARLAAVTEDRLDLADAPRGILPVPPLGEDPRDVDLEEKTRLLAGIEASARVPEVANTRARYTEGIDSVRFLDSSGNEASYEATRSGFSVLAIASRNGVMQMGSERDHVITGFNLRNRQDLGRKAGEIAVSLLDARLAKGGTRRAVLDPELAGVFTHEAVGHASEGDLVREGASVLSGRIGERIGREGLVIVDDPSLHEFGFMPVDAEGVAVRRTEIIRDGVLSSYLHNRETLAAVGNGVAGHARAEHGAPPIVRMSNTFIENGDAAYDEILAECKDGILLIGSRGGQVDPGRGVFQFNAEYGYLVEGGETTDMVRDVSLSGEILSTLHNIVLIGNDRKMSPGYCGKGGQNVPVSDGAPHLLLEGAIIGGRGE